MSEEQKIAWRDLPLHLIGDKVVGLLQDLGYRVGMMLVVTDTETGQVSSTTNLPLEEAENLIYFLARNHSKGAFVMEDNEVGGETVQ